MPDQSTAVMSPRFGTPGQCLARIADGAGSTSACQATSPPSAAITPRSSPPYPLHSEPISGPGRDGGRRAVTAATERGQESRRARPGRVAENR